jgi:hypothetical protein
MSTVQLAQPGDGPLAGQHSSAARHASMAPVALAGGLLLLVVYAAFSHGAVTVAAEARLEVAVAALAAAAGAAWLWSRSLNLSAPGVALAGIALLAAFAAWCGVTVLWSVAPDQTWSELNLVLAYVIVLCLGLALGASAAGAVELVADGYLLVVVAVACYGLGQKLFPGVHVTGVFDLNQTGQLPRLQEPLGYWNALALFVAMGAPIALALAADRERTRHARLGAIAALELMFLAIGLTYSRGGVIALVFALTVYVALSGTRLRSLMWIAAAGVASIPPLVFGLTSHSLTAAGVGLGHRELAGGVLAGILATSLLALISGGRRLLMLEHRVHVGPERARAITRSLSALAAAAIVASILAVTFSSRGLGGTVSHAWKSFTLTRETSVYDPHRLLSADSANRWVWWKEAAGAFSDRPIAGWGAGSFPVVHLLYRRDTLSVKQPHSVPLQWLAETGAIGALLAIVGFGLLLVAGVRGVRRRAQSPDRLLAAAILAGAVAYTVHAFYDWDWDIPGVTLPALVFLGVLAGSARNRQGPRTLPLRFPGQGVRALSLGALTLWLCVFAVSATLPSLAATKASSAIVSASGTSPADLQRAQDQAALASRLDPLSDAGLKAEATIAVHGGQLGRSRAYLLDAVRRDPTDPQAWSGLALVDFSLHDVRAGTLAAAHVFALDPRGKLGGGLARSFSQYANLLETPPKDSAAATPLPQR